MKKSLTKIAGLALLAGASIGALTGCSGGSTPSYKPGEKVKVGLICLHGESSTYDKNFIDAWKAAFKSNDKVVFLEENIKTDIPEGTECYDAAKALVKQGCNMIFADSFGHGPYMKQAAEEYRGVQFCHATGTDALTGGLDNFHNAFASIYEGRYLAGMAAGRALLNKGHSASDAVKVGYVGAWPYAEVISGYTSWYLGLREVLPNATMKVEYTNSWYDENAEREKANALINDGCVLISQHADSMGAPSACQEHNPKIPNVTYNISTQTSCSDTYVAYSAINWAPYYNAVVNAMYSGRTIEGEVGRNFSGTLSDGSVVFGATTNTSVLTTTDITWLNQQKDILKNSKDSRSIIFDCNKFTVTTAGGKNPNATVDQDGHLVSYMADTDGDFVPDTNAVLGGEGSKYFSESSFRSAPYFDCIINGITLA